MKNERLIQANIIVWNFCLQSSDENIKNKKQSKE